MRILYSKPSITDLEVRYAGDAAENGWGARCYEYIARFEDSFKGYIGAKYAAATSSATGALWLGMAALNIGAQDEVILADTNWIATVSPIVHLGASPVFVDILPDTWCIDPQAAEDAITPRTKAIVATHLYGNLCEMDALLEIGRRHNIPIIEDAAEAFGSRWHGAFTGSMGKFGVFSFHGTKSITTGEGGMFVTNDEQLYQTVLGLNAHGRMASTQKQFWSDKVGYKFKMSNIQAAIGCAQIERADEIIARKREIFAYYAERLLKLGGVSMNAEHEGNFNAYWMPTPVFDKNTGVTREKLLSEFEKNDIDGRVFFWPLSSMPMFKEVKTNINSYDIPTRAINLPSYHDLSDGDMDRVLGCVKDVFSREVNI